MDLHTRHITKLTDSPSILRPLLLAGRPEHHLQIRPRRARNRIYTMRANGNGTCSASASATANTASPVWSLEYDLIAFTKLHGGSTYIGVIRPDGSGEREITEAFHVERPDLGAERPKLDAISRKRRMVKTHRHVSTPSISPATTNAKCDSDLTRPIRYLVASCCHNRGNPERSSAEASA